MLKVWLPLDGTLENKGISNITPTLASGNSWASSGKIGTSAITLTKLQTILPTSSCMTGAKQMSYCYWVKVNTAWEAQWLDGIRWISTDGSTTHTSRQEFYTNCTLIGTWYSGGSISGKSFTPGVWTHIAATFDYNTGKVVFYINGIQVGTTSNLSTTHYCRGDFYIGDNGVNIDENDVRIYDHCLSAAEVHEISQGLILHYKLDGFFGGVGENLVINGDARNGLTGWSNWGTASSRQVITINNKNWFTFKTDANGNYGGFSQDRGIALYKPNTQYTISALMYASANASGRLWVHTRSTEGGANLAQYLTTVNVTTSPALYTFTFNTGTNASYTINKLNLMIGAVNTSSTLDFYISDIKVEEGTKATSWVPCKEEGGYNTTKIQDSSGYNHNGTINGNIIISSDTNRYNYSTQFDGVDDSITVPYNTICPENIFTFNLWFKKDALGSKNYETLFGGPSGFEMDTRAGAATSLSLYMASTRSGNRNAVTSLSLGNWYMITMTRDGTKERYYVNGIYQSEIDAKAMPTGVYRIGAWASNTGQNYYGLISDFRIYCTVLSADDILSLYHTAAKVDNLGGLHTFEAIENLPNIIFKIDSARGAKVFQDGLSRYTQSQCQVTLTDEGYHIYRPPNLVYSSAGKVMWGGLKLVNQTSDTISPYNANRDNVWGLQKTHTYLFAFHAKGQSSNSPSLNVQNNMGWDRIAGMGPNPTYISTSTIPANFNGEKDCYIIFTINDDIIKTATKTEGGYTTGEQYLSYRDLSLNYGYTDTGALGTDLYLTDFRLYDITNYIGQIKKTGITNFSDYVERNGILQIRNKAELLTSNLIER